MNKISESLITSSNSSVSEPESSPVETTALMDAHISSESSRHHTDKRNLNAGERPARKPKRTVGYGVRECIC